MKQEEMAIFLERIGTMLQKGYSLNEAIELYGILEDEKIKKRTDEMRQLLRQGEPFYLVLKRFNFPNIVLALLYLSEKHGNLSFSLIEGGKLLKEKKKNMEAIKQQLKYPIFLLMFMIVVLVIVSKQLLPQFEEVFRSLNYDIPSHLQLLVSVISLSPYIIISLMLALAISLLIIKKHKYMIKLETLLKVPFLRKYIRRYATQFFSLHLSCLLASGVSIKDCFTVFASQNYVLFLANETQRITDRLKDGEKIDDVIKASNIFEKELAKVIVHGQANSKLPQDLLQFSNLLQEDLQKSIKKSISLLQPIAFLIIGLVICFLFFSVIIPVFHMVQAI
jgi:competence protein ComGB